MDKKVNNMKINRITFLITGIIFCLFGIFCIPLLFIGALLLFLAYKTNKTYKGLLKDKENEHILEPIQKDDLTQETVKVTDLDGTIKDLSIYLCIDEKDKVLIAEGGKTYHTHLNCFKSWKPEMIENFTGWKIIKKSDALSNGMSYCKFCEEKDNYNDGYDLEDEECNLDYEE